MFKIDLLKELISKYNRSKSEKKDIWIKPYTHKLFKEYYSTTGFNISQQIDNDIKLLESKDFINVIYSNKDYERIYLNNNLLSDIYLYLNIDNPTDIKNELILKINNNLSKYNCTITNKYFDYIMNLNNILKEIHLDEVEIIFKGLYSFENQTEEILLRNFSKKVFGDSKYLEKNISKYFNIFSLFNKYSNVEDFLNMNNIFKNYRDITFKNCIKFKVNDQIIDLNNFRNEFILSSNCLESLELLAVNCDKVVTIENKTTFQYYNDDCLVIYTGGFPSAVLISFIIKINNFRKLSWYHYGDIDLGGFKIFNVLKEKTNIDFKPLNMNKEQLIKYKDECNKLSEKEINELQNNRNDYLDFKEVIDYMIEQKIKLEQESIE